jgi:hypothetical protein
MYLIASTAVDEAARYRHGLQITLMGASTGTITMDVNGTLTF